MALIKTEVFVCDECGQRKRLDQSKRHWCGNPSHPRELEMRPARIPAKRKPPEQLAR